MGYSYVTSNNLENRQNYQFSKFEGAHFLEEYASARRKIMTRLEATLKEKTNGIGTAAFFASLGGQNANEISRKNKAPNSQGGSYLSIALKQKTINLKKVLKAALAAQSAGQKKHDKTVYTVLSAVLQRFEVSKRLYMEYSRSWWGKKDENYSDIENYLLFADNLAIYYKKSKNLRFLNCLLKVNDTLCSLNEKIGTEEQRLMLYFSLSSELRAVEELRRRELE